jgi:hypothetical protein
MVKIDINKLTASQQKQIEIYNLHDAGVERDEILAQLNISITTYDRLMRSKREDFEAMITLIEAISKERIAEILEVYFAGDILASNLPFRFGMTKSTWACFILQHTTPQLIDKRNQKTFYYSKKQRRLQEICKQAVKPKKNDWGNADFSDNVNLDKPITWKQSQPNAWWS